MTSLVLVNDYSTFQGIADIRSKEAYCDATIACDGKFYKVHRLVLSASSEYLEQLFQQGNNGLCNCNCSSVLSHPVVVLQNIKKEHFEALLDYMYEGEVSVSQPVLPNIIRAAELLKIKGLTIADGDRSSRVPSPDFENNHGKRNRPQYDQEDNSNRVSSSRKNSGDNLSSVKRKRCTEEYEKSKDAKSTKDQQVPKSSKSTGYKDSSTSISKNHKNKESSASSLAIKSSVEKQRDGNKDKPLEKRPFVIPKKKLHLEIPDPSYSAADLSLVKREPLSDSESEKSEKPISDTVAMSQNTEDDDETNIEPSVRKEKIQRKSVTEPVHPMSSSDQEDDPRISDVDEQINENSGKDTEASDKDTSQSSGSTLNVSNLQKLGHLDKRNFMRKWKGHVEANRRQPIKDTSEDKDISKLNKKTAISPHEAKIKEIRNSPIKNQETSPFAKKSIIRSPSIAANMHRAEQLQKKKNLEKSEMRKSYDKESTNEDDRKRAELARIRYKNIQAKNMGKEIVPENSKGGMTSPEQEKQNDNELETNSVDSSIYEDLQPLENAASESGKSIAKSISEKGSPYTGDDGRGYICHICSKVYHKRVAFLNHYKLHTGGGDMPYGCPHCARYFSKKVELVKHVKGHNATRPYSCSHCPRRFTLKSCMLIHIQYHSGPKTFACPHCTKCFEDKGNIKRHISTHTGVPIATTKSSFFSLQN